jgi:hypothetical protein
VRVAVVGAGAATDGSGQVQPVLHAFGGTEAGLARLALAGESVTGR